ncbi:MAG: Thymidylate kinase [Chlamydiae bacterium]|nr:Thymidylate kinase [Chlamydiota bacterium]
MFVTFEGGEGAGKTTLIHFLEKELKPKGYVVCTTREPGGDVISEKLRRLLLESKEDLCDRTELLLFLAARAQHVKNVIEPALRENQVVLCDRFTDSTLAYQGYGRHMDLNILNSLCDFAAFSLTPDVTFYLDVPVEIGMQRKNTKGFDRMETESIEFHQKVRHAFLKLAKDHPKRIVVLDSIRPQAEIQNKVLDLLLERML